MKRFLYVTLMCCIAISFAANAQNKLAPLDIMVGKWKGSGWMTDQSGSKNEFNQTENIAWKVDKKALLIQGNGTKMESNESIFSAIALVYYNAQTDKIKFNSVLMDGKNGLYNFTILSENEFEWSLEVPGGTVQYHIEIKDNVWVEKGNFSRDGITWYPFMEMKLTKQ